MSLAAPTASELTEPSSEAVPSFGERFVGMMLRPRATLAGLREPDAWFWPAILLLVGYTAFYLAIAVGSGKYQASAMDRVYQQTPQSNPAAAPGLDWMLAVIPAAQIFFTVIQVPMVAAASWATRTGLFYLLARALGGVPAHWGRAAAMVGWAWVPLFIQYTLLGVVMLVVPGAFSFFLPMPEGEGMAEVARMLRGKWQGQVLIYLSPFVIWNLVLCVLGVEDVFQLPRWKASVVVLIPTIVNLVFQAAMYFFMAGMLEAMGGLPGANPTVPNGPPPAPP